METTDKPRRAYTRRFAATSDPFEGITTNYREAKITNPDGSVVFSLPNVEAPDFWSDSAVTIAAQKYFVRTEDVTENSVFTMIDAVAETIADEGMKQGYFHSPAEAERFLADLAYLLIHQYGAFNSPVWFNVRRWHTYGIPGGPGNWAMDHKTGEVVEVENAYTRAQVSACFIHTINDSLVDPGGIADFVKSEMRLFKFGSGSGANFSGLREKGAKLSPGGKASGLMSFLPVFDAAAGSVASGGVSRRAAKMIVVNVDHPEIEEFIAWKAKEERKAQDLIAAGWSGGMEGEAYTTVGGQNANNSVRVSDKFMRAVVDDTTFDLTSRVDGSVVKTVRARDLWEEIAKCAWFCADPGIHFDDTFNHWNTTPNGGRINATNPCVTGDTLVATAEGPRRIDTLLDGPFQVVGSDGQLHSVQAAFSTGVKPVYGLSTTERHYLKLTGDHKVLTARGDVPACELVAGDSLICAGGRLAGFTQLVKLDPEPVYDLTEPVTNHFVANGLVVHNCSEYAHLDNSACNLASLNLVKFLNEDGSFAHDRFVDACEVFILAQDILVGFSSYPTKAIAEGANRYRQLGLGYANLGSLLARMGLPYDSVEGRRMAADITSTMGAAAYRASAVLAEHMGPFAGYDQDKEGVLRVLRMHAKAAEAANLNSSVWRDAVEHAENHGVRNAQLTLLAPTGTISFLMDCDTTGVEPLFSHLQYKQLAGGGTLKIASPLTRKALQRLGYAPEDILAITAHLEATGNVSDAPQLRPEHARVFDTAQAISAEGHIRMMAAVQPFLSGAISKTVNLPTSTTIEEVGDYYMLAWKLGIKALAIYREGCKLSQPVTTKEKGEKKEALAQKIPTPPPARRKLPSVRRGLTWDIKLDGLKVFVRSGEYPDGTLGEVFVDLVKRDSTLGGLVGMWAKAVSLGLQYGVPLDRLIDAFTHTRFEPHGGVTDHATIRRATSIVDLVMRVLAVHYLGRTDLQHVQPEEEGEAEATPTVGKPTGDTPACRQCGSLTVRTGSCYTCPACGTSGGCG